MKTLSFIFTISFLLGCTQNKKNVIFKETIQMDGSVSNLVIFNYRSTIN